jgi:transcriptional antiterminator RfaH
MTSIDQQKLNNHCNEQWHVVLTKPNQELRALQNLEQQGFTCFLPMIQKEVVLKAQRTLKEEPLFKRYLFILFDARNSPWHVIRSTFGVSDLVRFGEKLATIEDAIITSLKTIPMPPRALYSPGELLRVTDGPFKDLEVVFQMQDGAQRAMVLIELLNKTHRLPLNLNLLKKVT